MPLFTEGASHFSESGCLILETNSSDTPHTVYTSRKQSLCALMQHDTQYMAKEMSPGATHTCQCSDKFEIMFS